MSTETEQPETPATQPVEPEVYSVASKLNGEVSIHVIILLCMSVLFISIWFWYINNLKKSGILDQMYQDHAIAEQKAKEAQEKARADAIKAALDIKDDEHNDNEEHQQNNEDENIADTEKHE
ncbi:MAG: hypothetical protein EZS28_002444 [Streblomastix strix]|uniref:Uncharacterized protein n=1 Tax=Streblomastix strix TaxID=222440 RepID=A0A5J4X5D5_9EUKA|nr:MAG: hypothetical protein EZS28_002444 [Streblomastix strix]